MVLVLTDDLIFSAKIQAAASRSGAAICLVADSNQLGQALREQAFQMAIVDLNSSKSDPLEMVRVIHQQAQQLPILGYCSHVQVELQQKARAVGCSQVLPRSIFVQQLPDLLKGN